MTTVELDLFQTSSEISPRSRERFLANLASS